MRTRTLYLLVVTLVLVTVAPPGVSDAIVGGNPTNGEDHPYWVRLFFFGENPKECGGSVIADEWVLTAAHCVADEEVAAPSLLVGAWSANGSVMAWPPPSVQKRVLQIIRHPLWNGSYGDGHDLALLRLPRESITGNAGTSPQPFLGGGFEIGIEPVQVGSPFDRSVYAAGTEVFMVGRGLTTPSGPGLGLRDLHTVLRSDGDMDDIYNPWWWFDGWQDTLMIGAGFTNHTICSGDSGGPLTVNRNGRIIQVGVASFGATSWFTGEDTCDQPGGYMELDGPQLAWLASVVPSIMAGWGPCTTSTGAPGDPYALYGNYSGAQRDGPYGWVLGCQGSTPPPPPDDPPDGPIDSVCMRKPWLCEDD